MSKRMYKELPIVKEGELLKEEGSKSVRQLPTDYANIFTIDSVFISSDLQIIRTWIH